MVLSHLCIPTKVMIIYNERNRIARPCQELISKYLDEDEPMREWLSRMNTAKVLFQKRAFYCVFLLLLVIIFGS